MASADEVNPGAWAHLVKKEANNPQLASIVCRTFGAVLSKLAYEMEEESEAEAETKSNAGFAPLHHSQARDMNILLQILTRLDQSNGDDKLFLNRTEREACRVAFVCRLDFDAGLSDGWPLAMKTAKGLRGIGYRFDEKDKDGVMVPDGTALVLAVVFKGKVRGPIDVFYHVGNGSAMPAGLSLHAKIANTGVAATQSEGSSWPVHNFNTGLDVIPCHVRVPEVTDSDGKGRRVVFINQQRYIKTWARVDQGAWPVGEELINSLLDRAADKPAKKSVCSKAAKAVKAVKSLGRR